MPRKLNTRLLNVGPGGQVPSAQANVLAGAPGVSPLVGQNLDPTLVAPGPGGLMMQGFLTHVADPKNAHPASAIQHDGNPDTLISGNVEGALDELIGALPPEPPRIGQWARHTTFSGIPDWGDLKLEDANLVVRGAIQDNGNDAGSLFPYYYEAPSPAIDEEFVQPGNDPRSDHLWNSGIVSGLLFPPGTGQGLTHIGGFTRNGDIGPAPLELIESARLMARSTGVDAETGLPARQAVTISGKVYPADRGVLALLHFPPSERGDPMTEFIGQSLLDRCIAALLMGGGILGDRCTNHTPCTDPHVCDGQPGGIFALGVKDGKYDPYAFPGRAAGQYDLREIHQGIDGLVGQPLAAPWNDLDDDGNPGDTRDQVDTVPAAGQVRLGTDPDSGVPAEPWGIPVLGSTLAMYNVPQPTDQPGSLSYPIVGNTLFPSTSNFFRYRLPVLKDYSQLRWTPQGVDPNLTQETFRFFTAAPFSAARWEDGTLRTDNLLPTAGHYGTPFDQDYWVWQIARYRHTFLMPSTQVDGLREEVGSYWLVHFKTERDFEKFVRDGIPPWHATEGYELYGSSLVDTTGPEETGNLANEYLNLAPQSPLGRAPEYGYKAFSYHQLRSSILLDPSGVALPPVTTASYDWDTAATPAVVAVMYCSGVAYFTPRQELAGAASFQLDDIVVDLQAGFWEASYRTDDSVLTGDATAPALVSSPCPAFLGVAPFSFGPNPNPVNGGLSATVPIDPNPALGLTATVRDLRLQHIEFPFTHMGSNGSGPFTTTNGPLDADTLLITQPAGTVIDLLGDDEDPSFVRDARLRVFFRRPLAHTSYSRATLPYSAASGHGVELVPAQAGTILFHSTRFDQTNKVGRFGNSAIGALPFTSFPELFPGPKDTRERFLDETYRYADDFSTLPGFGPYDAAARAALLGPGLDTWAGGGIEIPVRAGLAQAAWGDSSWLRQGYHTTDLAVVPTPASKLQVAGLPHRNPPLSASVAVPFPSAGVLMYPQKNYSVGYVPASPAHLAAAQPDYSGFAGDLHYLRAFDVAFSHWPPAAADAVGPRTDAVGQTTVVLRFDGIVLGDFTFKAPGPGRRADDAIAVFVKVPGLTTWMDAGRPDGAGPSKQDPNLDGAGCVVLGPETYDFLDPVTGYRGCYVKVHTGPLAPLFANTGAFAAYTSGDPTGEVPLLVKVEMGRGAVRYNLEYPVDGDSFQPAPVIGADPSTVRGVIGIAVVHPNETLLPPTPVPPPPPGMIVMGP